MILGMSLAAFTTLHVVISLVAIAAGLVALAAMIRNRRSDGWTAIFLATTVATSVTGFMFPLKTIGPPHIVGAISLVLLAAALFGLYAARLAGMWRPVYVATAVASLYLNVFVGVVQAFQKLPFLTPLAPTGTEPPFVAAQAATLLLFVALGWAAVRRYRPEVPAPAPAAMA